MRLLIASFVLLAAAGVAAQDPLTLAPAAPSHVTVSTSASASAVASGTRVTLFVDVTPKPTIHVYAPGADDYQPIKLEITRQPGVTIGPLRYPKSEMLVTEFERVPVFQKPFRLTQDVTIASRTGPPGADRRPVVIKGLVAFQACDDNVCFKPESIPVSWEIPFKK